MLAGGQYASVLHDIHCAAIGHVLRIGYRIPFQPRFNQTPVGVLINRRDGRFRHNDFFRRVVIVIARLFRRFQRRLGQNFVVGRIVETGDITAVGRGEQRQERRRLVVIPDS